MSEPVSTGRARSSRIGGVDGLRALAALWVVLFHMRAFSGARLTAVPGLDLFARSGSTGVSLFLVLSGFCLYAPFAGGRSERFGTGRFLARRSRRLLPAYYASLVVIVVITVIANGHLGLQHLSAGQVGTQVATHATLTHQLFPSTFYALNGAYWSLGLEWELYLTLPLLIFGVRRFGLAKTVLAVVAVNVAYRLGLALAIAEHAVAPHGAMATVVLPNLLPGRWAEFAFGMVAAELFVTGRIGAWARHVRYLVVALVPIALLGASNPLSHVLFGLVFFMLLCVVLAGDNFVFRFASSRPLIVLGLISYSLYLVHQPLVLMGASLFGGRGVSPDRVFLELVAALPVVLIAAWLLFVTVERHTLTTGSVEDVPWKRVLFPAIRIRSWARSASQRLHERPEVRPLHGLHPGSEQQ